MTRKIVMNSLAFVLILFLGIVNVASGQDSANTIGRVNISSPNAASLGRYGDVPVSYHTGIPEIGIPLYTIKSGSLSLPIGLSYHASGLKVEEQASWVGAGWSLNAGGMITRSVRGAADDRGNNNGYVNKGYYSDSGYYNYLFVPNINGGYNSTPHTNGLGVDDDQFVANRKDGEPDIYTFNFNGHSGKFYFNDDQSPMLVPEEDLKIQTDLTIGPGFQGFIITTPDGNKYYFGKTGNNGAVDPVENTFFITTQNNYGLSGRVASSWFLNKIISADGMDSILLNYQQESYSYYQLSMFPVYYVYANQYLGTWASYPYEYDLAKNFIQGVRLSSITFPNGSIAFNPASSPRSDLANYSDWTMNDAANSNANALASIQVSNNGSFCKKFKFYTGYFYDNINALNGALFQNNYPTLNNISTDRYRLRLDSVQELTCDSSTKIPPYRFSYFSELVPRKLSFGLDHWGFYNGVTNNTTLIPPSDMTTSSSYITWTGANRDASWPAMRGGSLQKISYPTGGYTKFDFEANTFYTTYTQNVLNGVFSLSDGFDGNYTYPKIGTFTTPATGYIYKLVLQSYQTAGNGGSVTISDPNNITVQGLSVTSGATVTSSFPLSPNTTYTVRSYNEYVQNGHGIITTIYAIIPTVVAGTATVGGLRIKTITSKDSVTANDNITSYSYTQANVPNGISSGILYSRPTYIQIMRNDVFGMVWQNAGFPNGCPSPDASPTKAFFRSPSSFRPMETTMGNHIGYNEVYVSQANNGYTFYRYYGSNYWDNQASGVATTSIINNYNCDPSIPNYPSAPLPFEPMRGELKFEGHYNQNGQVLKDVQYFPEYVQSPKPTPGHIAMQNQVMSSFTDYTLYTYHKTKDRKITTNYLPGGGSLTNTSTTYYASNYHHQPTRIVMATSTGDSIVGNMKYAFDLRANCDNIPDSLPYYLAAVNTANVNFASTVGSCTPQNLWDPGHNCRWSALIDLRYDIRNARITYLNYLKRNYSNANSIFNTCHLNAKNAAGTELKPILELQDFYQNPVIEQTKWKNTNLLQANFTRYDYVTNPSGKVYPNKTQLISLSSPSGTFTNAAVSGNTITKDSRYADEGTYAFANGRLTEMTGKDGVTSSYIWGYNNTLPVVKANAVSYATLLAAYNAVGGNLSQLRSQPSLSNALVSTYVYNPLVGMTSEADPRGRNIFYEYDKLNRLVLVRDHDNNIIKKICYNYAGQQENCFSSCTNFTPDWQNTSTAPTCQQNSCGNTGYQLQEQRDMNPCSPTYNQTQIITVYNPTACPPPNNVTLTYQNSVNIAGFTAVYTNISTNQTYTYNIPGSGSGTLGCNIPPGYYTVSISKPGNNFIIFFDIGCRSTTGTSAYFSKSVYVSSTTCNYINLGFAN